MKKEWFEIWFNTGYHDLLYQHRNEAEAADFIRILLNYLNPAQGASILDAACGKGRHAIILAKSGFEVTGIDLSYKNIRDAILSENDLLSFYQHDMRNVFRINYFDLIFNFYTSFGYFENEKENLQTMKAFASGLKKGGRLVIDFFNLNYILDHLVEDESKIIKGVEFRIVKDFSNGYLQKEITVIEKGETHLYHEKVKGLKIADFEIYCKAADLKIISVFGNYKLDPYNEKNSERMILIAEK